MTTLANFVASLRPEWGRDSMLDDLNTTIVEIENTTIPMCETMSRSMVGPFRSKEMAGMAKDYASELGTRRSMVEHITSVLKNAVEHLTHIADVSNKIFTEPNIVTAAFTYKKATVIRYIETIKFVSDYTRMLLQYAAVCETALADHGTTIHGTFSPAEQKYINSRFASFMQACKSINVKKDNFSKTLDKIPNTVVSENNETVLRAAKGHSEVDPFEMGFLPIFMNPFYHAAMAIAEWQANRYKRATDELAALQLRMANLDKLRNGTNDTVLQAQIKATEKQISDARYNLMKLHKKYNLANESAGHRLIPIAESAFSVIDSTIYTMDQILGVDV